MPDFCPKAEIYQRYSIGGIDMQFSPCVPGQCTEDGSHCQGCGRSHEEIAETKQLIMALVSFAQKMGYENQEDFANFIGRSLLKKLQNPA